VKFFPIRGTATKTSDYTLAPDFAPALPFLNATIPAGQSFVDLVVTPVNDTTAEGPETVTLELAPGFDYVIAGSQIVSLVIEDNDTSVPVVSMRVRMAMRVKPEIQPPFLFRAPGPLQTLS
jgi:hypothetical protein